MAEPALTAVALHEVTKIYPAATPVTALDRVTLSVATGDFVAIHGPSGSGKSTLLNLLGLLDAPTSGSVTIAGIVTATATDRQRDRIRREHIGFVFQAFHLISRLSVTENIGLPLLYHGISTRRARDRVETVADLIGLTHRANHRPRELSGGERQRCAIARALITQPAVLLCDEPTGNLDTDTTTQVLDLLERLNTLGQTIIVVSHDPMVAERSTHTIGIVDGRIA